MRQAGMEMGKAVAFFIIAGGAAVVMAILLATPLQVDLPV
jgi:hypothetical protein